MGPSIVYIGLAEVVATWTFLYLHRQLPQFYTTYEAPKQKGIGCTGTLRANMIQDCPLPPKAVFKKQKKGHHQSFTDEANGVTLAMWNDNGPVTVGSNFEAIEPLVTARRWSKEDKAYVGVPRPAMIGSYNQSMGGTDQMDQAIATYRPFVRNRKWYWPLLLYCLEVSLYNSWLIYLKFEKDCSFIVHLRSIATTYLNVYQQNKRRFPTEDTIYKNSRVAKRVDPAVRFGGKDHLLELAPTKSRCALCGKTVQKKCSKCGVKLHDYCFSAFDGLTE